MTQVQRIELLEHLSKYKAQVEEDYKNQLSYIEKRQLELWESCDHRNKDGSSAVQGYIYDMCNICGKSW